MQCMQEKKISGVIFTTNNKGNKGNPVDLDDNWKCPLHKVSHWKWENCSCKMVIKTPGSILKKPNSLIFKFIWQTRG